MESREIRSGPIVDHILSLEKKVWQALVEGDATSDRALLSDDFTGVYPTGFATRDEHVGQFAEAPTMAEFHLSAVRLRILTGDAVLLSYRADYRRPGNATAEVMLISSLWERRAGKWINTFSQDTPVV